MKKLTKKEKVKKEKKINEEKDEVIKEIEESLEIYGIVGGEDEEE